MAAMSDSPRPVVVVVSLQVQSSWQSVPLGAASVAAALRSDPRLRDRVRVALVDLSLEDPALSSLDQAALGRHIADRALEAGGGEPLAAAFSVYLWNRIPFEGAAEALASRSPRTFLVAGGPEVTADPSRFGSFHYRLSGEGERSAADLVAALLDGAKVPDSALRGTRSPAPDLETLPSPWLEGLLDGAEAVRTHRGALWELARGCPFSCAYCYESLGEKRVRPVPLPRLEAELEHFVRAGIERVFVLDPTYNANRERALSLLSLIERRGGNLHFNFEIRAELLDRELVSAFSRIPCSLQIGLQSSNPEALKAVNRPGDLKSFSKKIGLLNDAGIVFGLDLMYGLPGDSLATFRGSLDYALGLYPNNLEIFRLALLSGTLLYQRKGDHGLESDDRPPYLVRSTPKFPRVDLDRAEQLAAAADLFYTQGRAVTWFLAALSPLKLKPSQFLSDFAAWLDSPANPQGPAPASSHSGARKSHREIEALQTAFTEKKFAEKGKGYLVPAVRDIIALNGAWTRALAEGDPSTLELSFHPEDLFSPDAMDLDFFSENACMEHCSVRVFPGPEGPDLEML